MTTSWSATASPGRSRRASSARGRRASSGHRAGRSRSGWSLLQRSLFASLAGVLDVSHECGIDPRGQLRGGAGADNVPDDLARGADEESLGDAGSALGARDVIGGIAGVGGVDRVVAHGAARVGGDVLYGKAEEERLAWSWLVATWAPE